MKILNKDSLENLQCEMFKFFCYRTISISPKNQEKLSRRQSSTSKLVSKNYLEEIWGAICTISNIN